mmetsp:Transcript_32995/g.105842  ORF Transcript_32995/g.105842 Transcript_32995/m.105842 type:complete len:332 (-) Transcript_32995:81-1076(-)
MSTRAPADTREVSSCAARRAIARSMSLRTGVALASLHMRRADCSPLAFETPSSPCCSVSHEKGEPYVAPSTCSVPPLTTMASTCSALIQTCMPRAAASSTTAPTCATTTPPPRFAAVAMSNVSLSTVAPCEYRLPRRSASGALMTAASMRSTPSENWRWPESASGTTRCGAPGVSGEPRPHLVSTKVPTPTVEMSRGARPPASRAKSLAMMPSGRIWTSRPESGPSASRRNLGSESVCDTTRRDTSPGSASSSREPRRMPFPFAPLPPGPTTVSPRGEAVARWRRRSAPTRRLGATLAATPEKATTALSWMSATAASALMKRGLAAASSAS